MTGPLDLVPRLEHWLAEDDGVRLPERAMDALIAESRDMPQDGRRTGSRAFDPMRLALGTALLIGAGLLAVSLSHLVPTPVGTESPSPPPLASEGASASPHASAAALRASDFPSFGFSAIRPLREGPWENFLYAPIAVGQNVLTFPAGSLVGGDVWGHFIVVSVGTEGAGAVVGVSFPEVPSQPPSSTPVDPDWDHAQLVRIWATSADELAAAYTAAVGGDVAGPATLGGEPAIVISASLEMAQTVVCVHSGRAYVVSTTAFLRPSIAPGWAEFLASFRFMD